MKNGIIAEFKFNNKERNKVPKLWELWFSNCCGDTNKQEGIFN